MAETSEKAKDLCFACFPLCHFHLNKEMQVHYLTLVSCLISVSVNWTPTEKPSFVCTSVLNVVVSFLAQVIFISPLFQLH